VRWGGLAFHFSQADATVSHLQGRLTVQTTVASVEALRAASQFPRFLARVHRLALNLLAPLSLAARRQGTLPWVRLYWEGQAPESHPGVRIISTYQPTLPRGKVEEDERPLLAPGAAGAFLARVARERAILKEIGPALHLLARYYEEREFTVKLAFLCMSLEAAANGIARLRRWTSLRPGMSVRRAVADLRKRLGNPSLPRDASTAIQRLTATPPRSLKSCLRRTANHFRVRLDDIGCTNFDFIEVLRNPLFHGRTIRPSDRIVLEAEKLRCFLERMLLRILGWREADGSAVDGDGETVRLLRMRLKT
jgi:hypothetical protein